ARGKNAAAEFVCHLSGEVRNLLQLVWVGKQIINDVRKIGGRVTQLRYSIGIQSNQTASRTRVRIDEYHRSACAVHVKVMNLVFPNYDRNMRLRRPTVVGEQDAALRGGDERNEVM